MSDFTDSFGVQWTLIKFSNRVGIWKREYPNGKVEYVAMHRGQVIKVSEALCELDFA